MEREHRPEIDEAAQLLPVIKSFTRAEVRSKPC